MVLASGLTRWGSVPAVLLFMGNPAHAAARIVYVETEIEAPVEALFEAWTSEEGLRWFAPAAVVEPHVGGAYEIYMRPDAPAGERGSEGGKILAFDRNRLLTVQWAMPPFMPAIHPHQTVLTLSFEPKGDDKATITLTHSGFGRGPDWDEGLAYFSKAWPLVLQQMKAAIEEAQRS